MANSAAVNRIFSTSAATSARPSGITPVELMTLATMNSARNPGTNPRRHALQAAGDLGIGPAPRCQAAAGQDRQDRHEQEGAPDQLHRDGRGQGDVADGRRCGYDLTHVVHHHADPDPQYAIAEARPRTHCGSANVATVPINVTVAMA